MSIGRSAASTSSCSTWATERRPEPAGDYDYDKVGGAGYAASLTEANDAVAEDLPFGDDSVDADGGLREMRRVSRGPVVVLTMDPIALLEFWLRDDAPELLTVEASR